MTKRILLLVIVVVGLGVATWVVASTGVTGERPDCPGKIVCPQTGKLICRDRCPTVDPQRRDCPGRIVCPLTGELVCKDRCPVEAKVANVAKASSTPACCAAKK